MRSPRFYSNPKPIKTLTNFKLIFIPKKHPKINIQISTCRHERLLPLKNLEPMPNTRVALYLRQTRLPQVLHPNFNLCTRDQDATWQ